MRLGVISNPLSGGNRKGLGEVRKTLADRPGAIHREARTPDEVVLVMDQFAGEGVDIIAINGGDGTIQAVLTALFRSGQYEKAPLLAVLRSGTDSIIAEDIGLEGSRDLGLRRLLNWLETGDGAIEKRPVLKVQTAPDRDPLYGLIFGAAAVHQGIQYCKRRIYTLGLHGEIAPSLTLARFLLAVLRRDTRIVSPVPISIGIDQRPRRQEDFLLLYISTLERLFLGLKPHWGTEDAPLHLTAVNARPRHFLRALPSLARGRKGPWNTPESGYYSHNAHEIRLTMASEFILDGELYAPDPQQKSVVVKFGGSASFLRV